MSWKAGSESLQPLKNCSDRIDEERGRARRRSPTARHHNTHGRWAQSGKLHFLLLYEARGNMHLLSLVRGEGKETTSNFLFLFRIEGRVPTLVRCDARYGPGPNWAQGSDAARRPAVHVNGRPLSS